MVGEHVFRIELTNPSHTYFGGQIVEGRVFLQIFEENKTGGLELNCAGQANVNFTQRHSCYHDNHAHTEYRYYKATENYFEFKTYLLGGQSMSEQVIQAGTHIFPFQFQIPNGIPSSFQGKHGAIKYFLEADFKRSWKFDYKHEVPFTVNSIVDLNTWPGIIQPVLLQKEKFKCCLCCASGPITLTFRMDRTGLVPGQSMNFIMEVDNESTSDLGFMSIKLYQNIRFMAEGHSKTISTLVMELYGPQVDAGETELWQGETAIPALPPSGFEGCHIITLTYDMQPQVDIPAGFNLIGNVDITIGTAPLREQIGPVNQVPTLSASVPEPVGTQT